MKSSDKSFTLIELMMAVFILLTLIIGLVYMYSSCMLLNTETLESVRAANDAQYTLEQIKGLAYDNINSYTPAVFSSLKEETVNIVITQINPKLKEITINVNWSGRNSIPKAFSLPTRVFKQ